MVQTRQSPWRFGVPLVCLLAGLLLAATHGVSGGAEIRRSDAPRLVDLVRETQASVNRLSAQREQLAAKIDAAHGRFPRDASPDDLVVHQQDIQAVLNALWSAGAEAIQMQDQRIIATSVPRCVGNTLLLNGRTYSPPYTITAIGNAAAMQAALAAAPLVTLYKQYAVRFGLGYQEEVRSDVQVVGHFEPDRLHFAQPNGPIGY